MLLILSYKWTIVHWAELLFLDSEKSTSFSVNDFEQLKVHKMHTAVRLNELILEHSLNSQLVLLNLPKPPVGKEGLDDYIHYLEVRIFSFFLTSGRGNGYLSFQVLSDNINRVIFVRGTGKEVITANS